MGDPAITRANFPYLTSIATRWMDDDAYGHVNNVVYYSFFDTLVNRWLIDEGGLDIVSSPVIGYAIETSCRFHRPLAYPEPIEACLRVGHLGGEAAVARLTHALQQAECTDVQVRGVRASLEDVFIDLLTRRGEAPAAAGVEQPAEGPAQT